MTMKSDSELVQAVLEGGRAAYGELVNRYRDQVVRQCHRMTGNLPDAEDLAHEAFVEAFVKIGQLRNPARFGAWLRVVALNVCRMWLRARKRDWAAHEEAARSLQDRAADPDPHGTPLRDGLSRLGRTHRLMLALHYFEELSYEEIAQFLEVPIGTVMSRLHRARRTLKEALAQMDESEDEAMPIEDEFTEEVDAEVALLLQVFKEQPSAMERLTVILAHSPERFAELVAGTNDEETIHRLSVLLPRLGQDAMRVIVRLCTGSDATARVQAVALLRAAVGRTHAVLSGKKTRWGLPSPCVYSMLDAILQSDAGDPAKTELLADLMDAQDDEPTQTILACALLCFRDEAARVLLDRFWDGNGWGTPCVLYALCRMPALFLDDLTPACGSDLPDRRERALVGLEALARNINSPWLRGSTRREYLHELRTRVKWPPIRPSDLEPRVVRGIEDCAVRFVSSDDADTCASAFRILGHMRSSRCRETTIEGTRHQDERVRVAALLALAELGDQDDLLVYVHALQEGAPAERRAAAGLLSRFDVETAEPLLADLAEDADPKVRQAAVLALGEIDADSARERLRELLQSRDKRVVKAAASALYGGTPSGSGKRTIQDRILRQDHDEEPVAHISLDAAMRFAFDGTKPRTHQEITRQLAGVCGDYSATRRYLIEQGLMDRDGGVYEFTERGRAAWRVEHFILDHYLNAVCPG
ncbi:MAG: sigma-70 family RNA polymerase sigma factor [bacterium]|nr:sigma-70 family RNA polymerase sigma factor [bacterium]